MIYKLNMLRCNCFVIQYKQNNVLVDTSMKFERNRLVRELEKNNIERLDAIFITHNHADHIANAQWLSEKYNCKIYISDFSKEDTQRGISSFPRPTKWFLYPIYFMGTKMTKVYNFCKYKPCVAVVPISQEIVRTLIGKDCYLLKTEGHSPDSISFIIDGRFALVGDAMVHQFGQIYPPFANDATKIKESWKDLIATGASVFLPAHGSEVSAAQIETVLGSEN